MRLFSSGQRDSHGVPRTVARPPGTHRRIEQSPDQSSRECRGELGTYRADAEVLACDPNTCYKFMVATTFEMRNPNTRTGLSAKPKKADKAGTVKFKMTLVDERPTGYFATDDKYVVLQNYTGGGWKNVRGAKEFIADGKVTEQVKMDRGHGKFRASTATTSNTNGSPSPTVTLK